MAQKLFFFFSFLFPLISFSAEESSTCLMVYKEGGAPAVFQSPKCPRWTLSSDDLRRRISNCQSSMLQGRRKTQEDRTVCALDIRIPFPGRTGFKEASVGIVAVFDGHNGAEASDLASKLLLEYFFLHMYFLLDGIYSVGLKKPADHLPYTGEENLLFEVFNQYKERGHHNVYAGRTKWILPRIFDESFHKEILKESLLRTIRDIDATFSKDAYKNNVQAGSTATIVLMEDDQILVANVGDSKAFLCSEDFHSNNDLKGTSLKLSRRRRCRTAVSPAKECENFNVPPSDGSKYFCVKELTRDHHLDRDDERSRVEAAGGYVLEWGGVPRVNGELAISRAIGDVPFKSYGVTSVPEVTDWQPLSSNDSYLVAASDGVFEKMTTQDICDLLWDIDRQGSGNSEIYTANMKSLADCIVNTAFERGSMDNIAAVVVPLGSTFVPGTLPEERCRLEGSFDPSACGLQSSIRPRSGINGISSGLIPVEFFHQIMENLNRLVVEERHNRASCFRLFENLNEKVDSAFQAQKYDKLGVNYPPQSLSEVLEHHQSGGPLCLYNDQTFHWLFDMDIKDDKGQCKNPEGFARFLGLLESVPFHDTGSNSSGSFGHDTFDFGYIMKRRFDRGSYGEVWLAFQWNCSHDDDVLDWTQKNRTCSLNNLDLDPYQYNTSTQTNSSSHNCFTDSGRDDVFILKRIMVERGTAAYLSGLREKHFGEVFLNASLSLQGFTSVESTSSFSKKAHYDSFDTTQTNKSLTDEIGYIWNPSNTFLNNIRMRRADYEEGLKHIARYVESFESQSKEIWLVFRNEGLSLSKLIYTAEETKSVPGGEKDGVKNIQLLHPSTWWHWLRTTEEGKKEMRNLIWQLLMALKSCHDRNITHRDIKPENMVTCFEDKETGRCLREKPNGERQYYIKMRIIDFGSAIDEYTIKHLYGSNGPSRSEQTLEYMPPEGLLNASWFWGPTSVTLKYDMWSVGVVFLELILGSPHVFQISSRTRALLDQHLEGWNEGTKELAYKLRAFMEMCILIPGSSPQLHQNSRIKDHAGFWPASWRCSEESFSNYVKSRDPLKLGFPNIWALRLVRQLLRWHPEDRVSVNDALQHPYFIQHLQT